jgi:hypothetical protein
MVREVLVKVLFGFLLVFVFRGYGVAFLMGYVVGVEFMQACYRSFRDGYRWEDVYRKPVILVNYLKLRDTVLDLVSYVVGVVLALFLLQWM